MIHRNEILAIYARKFLRKHANITKRRAQSSFKL
jgi:hypothetical protein